MGIFDIFYNLISRSALKIYESQFNTYAKDYNKASENILNMINKIDSKLSPDQKKRYGWDGDKLRKKILKN